MSEKTRGGEEVRGSERGADRKKGREREIQMMGELKTRDLLFM